MELSVSNETHYKLIAQDSTQVIKATSKNSASGLIYKIDIDPQKYPIITWRWKVNSIVKDGDVTTKEGDDYAARIYITFEYDKSNLDFGDKMKYLAIDSFTSHDIPLRAINYV